MPVECIGVQHVIETARHILSMLANNWGKLAFVAFISVPAVAVMANVSNLVNK